MTKKVISMEEFKKLEGKYLADIGIRLKKEVQYSTDLSKLQEEYSEWLATKQKDAAEIKELMAQTFSLEEQMERGKAIYDRSCLACHGAKGEGGVGLPIAGSAIATGDVGIHLDVGINGVPGTAMQAFGGQLNDVDMAAVITYQRNAFGNNMGDLVQPIDVFNHKKGQ